MGFTELFTWSPSSCSKCEDSSCRQKTSQSLITLRSKKLTINEIIINNLTDPSVQHLIDNRSAIILISFNLLIKTIQLIDFAITFPTHKNWIYFLYLSSSTPKWKNIFKRAVWLYIFTSRAVFWWALRARYKGRVKNIQQYCTLKCLISYLLSNCFDSEFCKHIWTKRKLARREAWYVERDWYRGVFWLVEKITCQSGSLNWTKNHSNVVVIRLP